MADSTVAVAGREPTCATLSRMATANVETLVVLIMVEIQVEAVVTVEVR